MTNLKETESDSWQEKNIEKENMGRCKGENK